MRIKESSCTQRAMISMAMSLGPTLGTHSGSSSCTSTMRACVVCEDVGGGGEGVWSECEGVKVCGIKMGVSGVSVRV